MSVLELPVEEPLVEPVPFSVRLARRLAAAGVRAPAAASLDRRTHPRRPGGELQWIRGARLKAGPDVSLVDISSGGALIESRLQLLPGSQWILQIAGPSSGIDIPFDVLRCQIGSIQNGVRYRGAGSFARPFDMEHLDRLAREATAECQALPAGTPWQKIVVRFRDGGLQKGFTLDFSPGRGHFSLWPTIQAAASERSLVPLARLKAVFFVRDFAGNPGYVEKAGAQGTGSGRRVEVTFLDKEVLRGRTLNYRPDAAGFFLTPEDPQSNNERIYVVASAVRSARFP